MTQLPLPRPNELTRPYWDAAKRHQLVFQRCRACHEAFLYPRPLCPSCWQPDPEWAVANGLGTVVSCSVVHQPPYEAYAARVPYVVAIVALIEGPQLMANIVNCDPDYVKVGMKVSVTFEERDSFSIPQFMPLEGDAR